LQLPQSIALLDALAGLRDVCSPLLPSIFSMSVDQKKKSRARLNVDCGKAIGVPLGLLF
jgi:hypothetical protein